MKLNKNINYETSLRKLFDNLKFAEEKVRSNDEYKYPNAYGRASMAIKLHLAECTDMDLNKIDAELKNKNNDNTTA